MDAYVMEAKGEFEKAHYKRMFGCCAFKPSSCSGNYEHGRKNGNDAETIKRYYEAVSLFFHKTFPQ